MASVRDFLQFVGECSIDTVEARHRAGTGLRWNDCLNEMQKCGAMALPIVSLISFLVGVTLAYSGSIVLKRFGGEIWVADLIGVAMTREMGALMAAIVLAGRTGAAFAAEIGSMKANEEIDALATLGISPVRFLVMPAGHRARPHDAAPRHVRQLPRHPRRHGGGLRDPRHPARRLLGRDADDRRPVRTWSVGMIKAVVFGLIVGLSGCLRGLQADRNASGVGHAATSAVVTAILLIIVADAIFAVLFNAIGL